MGDVPKKSVRAENLLWTLGWDKTRRLGVGASKQDRCRTVIPDACTRQSDG